jgi:hypothetical protein
MMDRVNNNYDRKLRVEGVTNVDIFLTENDIDCIRDGSFRKCIHPLASRYGFQADIDIIVRRDKNAPSLGYEYVEEMIL